MIESGKPPLQDASDKRKKMIRRILTVALCAVFFGAGIFVGKQFTTIKISPSGNVDMSLFWDAYNKLEQNYITPSAITNQNVVYGAITGMTSSLGDPYTEFFDPTDAKAFEQDLAGSFDGIGIEVGIKQGILTVIAPLKGTPADQAGIVPGDEILKINGQSTSSMTDDDAANLIRGQKGTSVTLSIMRAGFSAPKNFVIMRQTIVVPSISWDLEDGNVAVIHIYQFDQTLSADFATDAGQILKSPAKKIIIDVRGNPGGYLEVCQYIAGWFLQPGQLVTIEDFGKGKPQQQYKAEGNAAFANYPVVVLIDGGSASASEILSGALRDDRNVQLVGAQSFGKGSVQEVVNLEDGQSFLKITIAHWLTPKGYSISEIGLAPDVKVAITAADVAAGKDPQLAKALEIINGLK